MHTEALPSADRTCPNQNSIIPYYVKLYNTKKKKIGYNVFKGHNFYNHHSQQVDFVLLEAARINIMDNYLAE